MKKQLKREIKKLEEQLEAIIIAIPKEDSSYRFYSDLAHTFPHEETRKMFRSLAEQERDHKQKLEFLAENLRGEIEQLKMQMKK